MFLCRASASIQVQGGWSAVLPFDICSPVSRCWGSADPLIAKDAMNGAQLFGTAFRVWRSPLAG